MAMGLAAACARAINPAGMALVTAAVATIGDAAVAGFGAAARIQSVAMIPFLALASGMAPMVGQSWMGQSWGKCNTSRARNIVGPTIKCPL